MRNAPPHAVAHVRRGVAHKFGQLRTSGQGAVAAFLALKSVRFTYVAQDKHIKLPPVFWLMRLFLPRLAVKEAVIALSRRYSRET